MYQSNFNAPVSERTSSLLRGRVLARGCLLPTSVALGVAFAVQPALAAPSADSDGQTAIEEVVVTAQRREQSLQDVGIAVAALSSDTLQSMGVTQTTDIAQFTPGVFVSGSVGGQSQQFSIRGVTQSDFNDAVEAPVAVYIDDVYVASQQGQGLALFDVERVEVLKGPQGTLFGRNATGGLVHTVVAKPDTDKMGGFVEVSYGRFNLAKAEGALNVPMSSTAALRVSGYYNRIDNYWKNKYPAGVAPGAPQNFAAPGLSPTPCCQDEGGSRTYAGRAQLLLEPSSDLKIRLSAAGGKQDLSTGPYTSDAVIGTYNAAGDLIQSDRVSPTETRIAIGPNGENYTLPVGDPSGFARRVPGATWFGYVPLDPESLTLSKDFARSRLNWVSSWSTAAHIDYALGDIDIASITAYQRHKKYLTMDADGGPTNLFAFIARADNEVFTQELRASGGDDAFRWTAGAYYVDVKSNATQTLTGPRGSFLAVLFLNGDASNGLDLNPTTVLHTKSFSGFGQAEIGLAEKWKLIVGGRLIRERQSDRLTMNANLNTNDYDIDRSVLLFPFAAPFADHRSKTLWAGKAQLEYRPIDDLLLYFGVNRGVKGGSYNAPGPGTPLTPEQLSYDPETLLSYEGGFKYGHQRFSFNGSAYYYDYSNYQAFLFANASGFVSNVDSKVYGAEFDLSAELVDGLRATVGASFSHGEIKNFQVAPNVVRTVRPTYAPRTQISASLNYEVPADLVGGRLSFNVNGNYSSGFYANIRNFNSDWMKSRTLFNLSGTWFQESSGLSVSAFLNNATDERYPMIGFNNTANCGCNDVSYGMPRTYGVSLGYKF